MFVYFLLQVVRPDDYIKEQRKVKRSVAKTPLIRNGDKTQVVERKLTINEKDAFWEILEVILREKANLSRTEVTNFVNIMKKVCSFLLLYYTMRVLNV